MTALLLGAAIALAAASALGEGGFARVQRLQDEHARAEARNAALAAENEQLIARVEALRDDPEIIATVARDQLGLVRPGEIVIRFEVEE
ncbi:MAG: septum formation initiator family protein [Deltaproteobacteria bacterium]|nr:septum formation initiator family protein [Deltaproteobacteria bacterium]